MHGIHGSRPRPDCARHAVCGQSRLSGMFVHARPCVSLRQYLWMHAPGCPAVADRRVVCRVGRMPGALSPEAPRAPQPPLTASPPSPATPSPRPVCRPEETPSTTSGPRAPETPFHNRTHCNATPSPCPKKSTGRALLDYMKINGYITLIKLDICYISEGYESSPVSQSPFG